MKEVTVLLFSALLVLTSCSSTTRTNRPAFTTQAAVYLIKNLGEYKSRHTNKTLYAEGEYRRFYDLDFPGVTHTMGFFKVGSQKIFAQSLEPSNPKAAVIFAHGLFEHSGQSGKLYAFLLELGYAVYMYDLPGHGLSSGVRNSVEHFGQYSEAFF